MAKAEGPARAGRAQSNGRGQGVVDAVAGPLQSREGPARPAARGPRPCQDARLHLTFTSRTHRDHALVLEQNNRKTRDQR
jgi:hypothetical protein